MHTQTLTITIKTNSRGMELAKKDAAIGEKGARKIMGSPPLSPEGHERLLRAMMAARAVQIVEEILPEMLAAVHTHTGEASQALSVHMDAPQVGTSVQFDVGVIETDPQPVQIEV